MAANKPEWPEPGDLVIATIQSVTDYGAYAKLDEYDKQGLLHISEISSSWVRNIRDFVRENQKIVLKVLRVD
ncbi:MAG TPA: S1 RNA-binding domain-containing protein, partial [Candidatus Acidoferrum sp.]|nr:S1 RNA-binding domain-containing protein [Candidatus Acidoferrum sp.]